MNQPDTSLLQTFHMYSISYRHAQQGSSPIRYIPDPQLERQWTRSENFDRTIRSAVRESARAAHMQARASRQGGFDCTLVKFFTACQASLQRAAVRDACVARAAPPNVRHREKSLQTKLSYHTLLSTLVRGCRRSREPARSSRKVTF